MRINVVLGDAYGVVRDGVRCLLEAHGDIFVVGDADNGRDLVRLVRQLKPDVAVMEIAMSEMNGIEATAEIRRTCPTVRVLMLSRLSSLNHVRQALKAGAHGYLLKKAAGAELLEAVRAVHTAGGYLSQQLAGAVIEDYNLDRPHRSPLDALTRRERQILQLIAEGKSNSEASRSLFLSPKTVETYRYRMMQKLGLAGLADLIKFALRHGVATLE